MADTRAILARIVSPSVMREMVNDDAAEMRGIIGWLPVYATVEQAARDGGLTDAADVIVLGEDG